VDVGDGALDEFGGFVATLVGNADLLENEAAVISPANESPESASRTPRMWHERSTRHPTHLAWL